MEIVISDTNIFIDLWNIGLLERFCELPLSIQYITNTASPLYYK